jgi:hypothetical protein
MTYLSGKPAYIALKSPSETTVLLEKGPVQTLLDQQALKSIVAQAARPYSITESRLVTQYEPYYSDRANGLRLPALFLRLDDPQQTILYLDPYSGRVVRSYSRWERLDHWLYQGLHDFEIPWLYRHRPLWDNFRVTGDSSNPIAIHSGSPFFEVAQYRDRWFLRDGYHRAFRCLQAQVFHLPAIIVKARTLEELGAVHPWFFPEEVLLSAAPRVIDFLDGALVIEYHRSPLIKTLRITVEETYTLRGENL